MKLKVCGLSNPKEVDVCINNKVNFCGFILNYPKSHRHISFEKAKEYYEKGEFSKGGVGAADIRKANRKKLMKRKTGGMVIKNYKERA